MDIKVKPPTDDPDFEMVWEFDRPADTPEGRQLHMEVSSTRATVDRLRQELPKANQRAQQAATHHAVYRGKLQISCQHQWVPYGAEGEMRCEGVCQSLWQRRKPRSGQL